MPTEQYKVEEDETPTMKRLRSLVRQIGEGTVAYETVIPQAVLTLLLVGSASYLALTGQQVPEWLLGAVSLVIGFYFGSDFTYRRIIGKARDNG